MDIQIQRSIALTSPTGSSVTARVRQPSHRAASVAMMHVATLTTVSGHPTAEQVSELYAWAEGVCVQYVDDIDGLTVGGVRLADASDRADWWAHVPPGLTLSLAQQICTAQTPGVEAPFDPWATSRV